MKVLSFSVNQKGDKKKILGTILQYAIDHNIDILAMNISDTLSYSNVKINATEKEYHNFHDYIKTLPDFKK